ncbi:MAG: hypothetical protein WDM78_20170 [Puia sp.]
MGALITGFGAAETASVTVFDVTAGVQVPETITLYVYPFMVTGTD